MEKLTHIFIIKPWMMPKSTRIPDLIRAHDGEITQTVIGDNFTLTITFKMCLDELNKFIDETSEYTAGKVIQTVLNPQLVK